MRRSRWALGLVVLAASFSLAPAALAEQVSGQQFDQLVQQASNGDQPALDRLRQVDSIDGQPVNMRRALDANGQDLQDRLRALGEGGSPTSSGTAPRDEAKQILSGGDYHESEPPRPFKRPLERLGDWIERAIRDIARSLQFGNSPAVGWLILAVLVAGAVAVIVLLVTRARVGSTANRNAAPGTADGEDPAELERQADLAEKAGDYSLAVRLRYRAGLLRLDAGRAIEYRPSLTAHQVSERLESERYDELADRFEGIAYGEQEASAEDSERAAAEWREVVKESRK